MFQRAGSHGNSRPLVGLGGWSLPPQLSRAIIKCQLLLQTTAKVSPTQKSYSPLWMTCIYDFLQDCQLIHSPDPYHIEWIGYFWIWLTLIIVLQCFTFITHSPPYVVSFFHLGCVPHSLIHLLTHPLMSAYSFLSWTHLPLFSADSFIYITHSDSDLLTNHSHAPYLPLFSYHFLLW